MNRIDGLTPNLLAFDNSLWRTDTHGLKQSDKNNPSVIFENAGTSESASPAARGGMVGP